MSTAAFESPPTSGTANTAVRLASAVLAGALSGCSLIIDDSLPPFPGEASCGRQIGPVDDPSSFVVGAILPLEGDFASIGIPMLNAIELAVVEINETGGLGDGVRFGVIACDSSGNLEQGKRVTGYLADVKQVPLIIGPAFSGIFIDVTTTETRPRGVMTLSPSATSPLIGGLDDDGLAWRTAASDEFQGVAMADLVQMRGYERVIALGKRDAYGDGLLREFNEALGASLGESNYVSANYDNPGDVENPDYATPISDVLRQVPNPDVILLLGTTEVAELMRLFESQFEQTATSTDSRPTYLFADGGKVPETLVPIAEVPSLYDRIEGTEADHQAPGPYERFALAYQQRFREPPRIYATNSYDAAYLAAYAAMAVGRRGATGTELAQAMSRLVVGTIVDTGPTALGSARATLREGGSIDYNGVSGPLDFDLATGEAPANVSLWRPGRRPDGTVRFDPVPALQYLIGPNGRGTWQ